ncbi:hypothetical protein J6524_21160 [Bradyrhizobium sp. WSM 1738]|uniref:hypothetical protein n=1 Tax=Bradyrhizobium hereditatis TaxID=2821405 RepID=UPI001CE29F56|nr:hypothetical protein [Bradyrhizobium hereditatis]MCA6117359.1 hypothetical protein [Bradyrhizobium hereditatis]
MSVFGAPTSGGPANGEEDPKPCCPVDSHLRKERSELCVFLRLKRFNQLVQDYVLSPAADNANPYLTLSDGLLTRYNAVRGDTVDEPIAEIKMGFITSSHAALIKPTLKNKRRKRGEPKTKTGRRRH